MSEYYIADEKTRAELRAKYPKEYAEAERLGEECWELTKDGKSFTLQELENDPEKLIEITFKDGTKKIVKVKDQPCFKSLVGNK